MPTFISTVLRSGYCLRGVKAQVSIYLTGTETPATLTGRIGNVVETDADGGITFEAAAGTYDLYVEAFGTVEKFTVTLSGLSASAGIISAVTGIKARNPTIVEFTEVSNIFVGHVDTSY